MIGGCVSESYHSGSIAVQERAGERTQAASNGRLIADRISEKAQSFLAKQSYCALGWADSQGMPWSCFLEASAGFASGDANGTLLQLDLRAVKNAPYTVPDIDSLHAARRVGMLFIDLENRRRLRVNGLVKQLASTSLQIQVAECFPNCPKYIQSRTKKPRTTASPEAASEVGSTITPQVAALVSSADTAFIASMSPDGQVECSHRGGRPGFVQIEDGTLRVPDYPGNSMFKTLGNLLLHPHAALCFVDFDSHRQLQMVGDVQLDLDAPTVANTRRRWSLVPRQWKLTPLVDDVDWQLISASPFNP
jgi:predicted pyridoxine 5'-phosphate oxidase superfamily flavin-nucleotide-binding protein